MSELQKYITSYFGVTQEKMNTISSLFQETELKKGEFYTKSGQYCEKLSFVHSGYVRMYATANDKEVTQWISTKGHFVTGTVAVGEQIKIKLQGMTFKPKVLTLKENEELKWLGHLLFKGLFDGEHQFRLTDKGDGTTLFEQNETFNGLLVSLFSKSLDKDTKNGFEQMNKELKSLAEQITD